MDRSKKSSPLNVCVSDLVKFIKCDYPCSEGYEVGNLISKNLLQRNKGFLVERFIKPPVKLTFEFSCSIDLKCVLILCSVGGQKTTGIEMSVQPHSSENQFEYVCSGVLTGNEKGFVFHRFSEDLRTKFGNQFCYCALKSSCNLSQVKSVRIKIFRTQGSSVPALGKVDIWGIPCKTPAVSSSLKNQNVSRPNKDESIKIKPSNPSLELSREMKTFFEHCKWSKSLVIPEDFIDPITCELMCQPITLPSGKVIDVSTLEMYEKAESQWGRGPSDPFTSVLFTSSSKPIAASDLKARIDKFLCDNSDHPELKFIPRTVGRSLAPYQKSDFKHSVSKLVTGNRDQSSGSLIKSVCSNASYCDIPVKKRKEGETKKQSSNVQSVLGKTGTLSQPNSGFDFSHLHKSNSKYDSFQERMEKSLELSLKSTLSSFPSFISDDRKYDEKSLLECNMCKSSDKLFSIPCSHFICRNCLLNCKGKSSLSCLICKLSFKSHNVHKVHVHN